MNKFLKIEYIIPLCFFGFILLIPFYKSITFSEEEEELKYILQCLEATEFLNRHNFKGEIIEVKKNHLIYHVTLKIIEPFDENISNYFINKQNSNKLEIMISNSHFLSKPEFSKIFYEKNTFIETIGVYDLLKISNLDTNYTFSILNDELLEINNNYVVTTTLDTFYYKNDNNHVFMKYLTYMINFYLDSNNMRQKNLYIVNKNTDTIFSGQYINGIRNK